MAKTKRKKLTAVKLVKTMSRAHIGKVPGQRVIPDKRRKAPKHKKSGKEVLDVLSFQAE